MPIQRVLVPLDGTPFAEQALRTAADLARRGGGSLVLLHVRRPAPDASLERDRTGSAVAAVDRTTTENREEHAARYLERIAARIQQAGEGPLDVRTLQLAGAPADAVRDACARDAVDLVVLASHTRGAFGQALHGSIARHLIDGGPHVPVLVVRGDEDDPAAASTLGPVSRILASIGDDVPFTVVAAAATDLAELTGAALTLVTVQAPPRGPLARLLPTFMPTEPDEGRADESPEAVRAAERDAAQLLASIAARATARGLPTTTHVIEDDDAPAALARYAEEVRADVVVVGQHGHAADALRRALRVPVLFVSSSR